MQIYGYSERGILNTLFNEIAYSPAPEVLLSKMLALAKFPMRPDELAPIRSASVLIEQSLSDFGDADAIMLFKAGSKSTTVFIEAKVKPSKLSRWTIEQEYRYNKISSIK